MRQTVVDPAVTFAAMLAEIVRPYETSQRAVGLVLGRRLVKMVMGILYRPKWTLHSALGLHRQLRPVMGYRRQRR
jgi:hypothetical protein